MFIFPESISCKTAISPDATDISPLRNCVRMYVCLFNVLGTNWGPTDRVLFMQILCMIDGMSCVYVVQGSHAVVLPGPGPV